MGRTSRLSRAHRVRVGPLLVAGVLSLLVAACSSGEPSAVASRNRPGAPSPAGSPVSAAGALAPLTGAPASAPGSQDRPIAAVPIRAQDGAPLPQGLLQADIVYVEYAEPGLRRMLSLFASQVPAVVGPVGGARPADRDILRVANPLYVFSSSYKRFAEQIGGTADLASVTSSSAPPAFRTEADAQSYALLPFVYQTLAGGRPAALPLLTHAEGVESLGTVGVAPATSLIVAVPGHAAQTWRYDPGTSSWVEGSGLTAQNVVVQRVDYKDTVTDKSGHTVPSARVVGDGAMQTFAGPTTVSGSWHKPRVEALTNYVDGRTVPVRFAAGRTVILLVPPLTSMTVS